MHWICLQYKYDVVQKYEIWKLIQSRPGSNAAKVHGHLGGIIPVWIHLKGIWNAFKT